MSERRKMIQGRVETAVANLLYYDRKEDEELPRGEIEAAIDAGEVTTGEIVEWFEAELKAGLNL